jgi:hypothetical protein
MNREPRFDLCLVTASLVLIGLCTAARAEEKVEHRKPRSLARGSFQWRLPAVSAAKAGLDLPARLGPKTRLLVPGAPGGGAGKAGAAH